LYCFFITIYLDLQKTSLMSTQKTGAASILSHQNLGAQQGVNPSISDSSTYAFPRAQTMADTFEGNTEGCYLYSRHSTPTNNLLAESLAAMEGTEAANVFGSGMGAISAVLFQLCSAQDHIVSSRTIYGGTYALLKNFMPKFGVQTTFVDSTDLPAVAAAITPKTKVLYCEAISNPLLEVTHLKAMGDLARKYGLTLVVDNTFSPLMIAPMKQGAHVVIHSLTKFINGTSDAVAGVVCGTADFCNALKSVHDGAAMLFGSTLDSARAASILKNLKTLPIRMVKHSQNAAHIAQGLKKVGYKVMYPGLEGHRGKTVLDAQLEPGFGHGGLMTLDAGSIEKANALMEAMQEAGLGYLAVSLGFYKTLFSASGSSTSSEISDEEQKEMGLSHGLIRFSIGLDHNPQDSLEKMLVCIKAVGITS
jgi:methionine-gamma-lyase